MRVGLCIVYSQVSSRGEACARDMKEKSSFAGLFAGEGERRGREDDM